MKIPLHPDLRASVERFLLPHVEKPMRYAGGELNAVCKDPGAVSLRGVLCFPDMYDIGMSHYGSQILYHIVNKHPSWTLSRCFSPAPDAEAIMRRHGIPLFTLEYFSPVGAADWIGFSVQYELQATNILNMLDLAGVPLTSSKRRDGGPIIIAGGPCVGNPEPLAAFIDAFVIGDGERAIVEICAALDRARRLKLTREETVRRLSGLDGVYVPALVPVRQSGRFQVPDAPAGSLRAARIQTLAPENYPVDPVVPLIDVVHHRLAVEVMRGCTRGCRFCSAGMQYRPLRERPPEEICAQIEKSIAATGWRDVGLLSLSSADYGGLDELLARAARFKETAHIRLSMPSTRIDALSPAQFDAINSISSASSFTIAPEAGSERLRRVINKGLTDQQIIAMASMLMERNVQTLKLYFMIGLPTETDEDMAALINLVSAISGRARALSGRKRINVSLSPFSPKPHTPFQWEAASPAEILMDKSRRIKQALSARTNVKVSYRGPDIAFLETVMARGDRRMSRVIAEAWQRGAKFDGWEEHFDMARWRGAAAAVQVDLNAYADAIPLEQELPWHGIFAGVSREFLLRERQRAYDGVMTGDCRSGACNQCGACTGGRVCVRTHSRPSPAPAKSEKPAPAATERHYYRFVYSKARGMRFLGHLDMVRVFERAFLAAGISLEYSSGFTVHPRIAFGPPLPRGATGDAELFDAVLTVPLSDGQAESVNRWLPQDLRLIKAAKLPAKPSPVNAAIAAARYRFLPMGGSSLPMADALRRFEASEKVVVECEKEGVRTEKEIRSLVFDIAQVPGTRGFQATLSLLPGKTCKPSELVRALFPGLSAADFLIARLECLTRKDGNLVAFQVGCP
jgi:radical SAM family uncharacterized protein/radical SAM-linked protein